MTAEPMFAPMPAAAQFSDEDREAWSDLLYMRDLADAIFELVDSNFREVASRITLHGNGSVRALLELHGIHPWALSPDDALTKPPPSKLRGEERRRAVMPDDPPRQRTS